jgi:hypothetical protein
MSPGLVLALVGAGSAALVGAVWARWPPLILWGLAALGCSYAVGLVGGHHPGPGLATPLVAAGLLAVGEAAFHGAERVRAIEYPWRQAARVALAALAALAVSAAVLLAATIAVPSSLVLTVGGTLAAVIAIALPSVRFRQRRDR